MSEQPREARVERTRMSDDVYENLQSMLVDGVIEPGQRIRIDTLSRQLGVSQTPVREALLRLEALGVVTKTHLIGYSATPKLTLERFEELFEARFLVEPHCAGLAASRHRGTEVERISAIASDMRHGYEAGRMSYGAFAKSDAELHSAIIEATGNSYFATTFANFHCHLQLFRLMRDSHVTDDALDEHDLLITAIRQRDPDAASSAMTQHLTKSRSRLRAAFATTPPAVAARSDKAGLPRSPQRGRRNKRPARRSAEPDNDHHRPMTASPRASPRRVALCPSTSGCPATRLAVAPF